MPSVKQAKTSKIEYHLGSEGKFVIENFQYAKPMANFFPGIAGKYGIPMWVFYVNRGQAISCFGIDGKDTALLEFQPANKAWQQTSLLGFRTFIKVFDGKKESFYEPFHNGFVNRGADISNSMAMTSYDLTLHEENKTLGLTVDVEYFTVPEENYAALVRTVTVTNTSRKKRKLQLLDGLPRIVTYGVANLFLKKLSRTIEAWMRVENMEKDIPFYKVDVDPIDRPQVLHIKGGNFFLGFHYAGDKARIVKPIVDPEFIFGEINDFSCPRTFLETRKFSYPKGQQTECKTPCGFLPLEFSLNPKQCKTFYEVIGNARDVDLLNSRSGDIIKKGYLEAKRQQNRRIIEDLQHDVATKSSSAEFDMYTKQTYLDNLMRGGYPTVFGSGKDRTVFYLYSRKHGDLERDYNKFQIEPTYFSQGNGNYRDMNQNRRLDTWFNPAIKDYNVTAFMNLLQLDGYNPLVIKGATFSLNRKSEFLGLMKDKVDENGLDEIVSVAQKKFTPGRIILLLEEKKIKLKVSRDEFLSLLLSCSDKNPEADHGEGFWIDHWHYNLDLLESYLAIFPENLKDVLFEKKDLTYYDNDAVVRPRSEKYILLDGQPKQLHSVLHDPEKKKLISSRESLAHTVRTDYGKGSIYKTTVFNKLLCLFANKIASLDPFGVGIEMEADKPNWFDALNGLPALSGSSSCETFELKRLVKLLRQSLTDCQISKISLTEEIAEFITSLGTALRAGAQDPDELSYWDTSHNLKEQYRQKTKFGVNGKEIEISSGTLTGIFDLALEKISRGLKKSKCADSQLYYGYFINEVTAFDKIDDTFIKPRSFAQKKVPFFLEGQMHALRLTESADEAKALYEATRKSELFDKKLSMYKVTASLKDMPLEIGRCTAFTPGWLENESIWLHMEYKYLLEILEHGLHKEFHADLIKVLIPFQKPDSYGRSILENSSFIVSSAFPYPKLHGNGFVARLSGSTVEFLQMWLVMNAGKKPFYLNSQNKLELAFKPSLASWMFEKRSRTYSFRFLSTITVTYHNPKLKDTFGPSGAAPKRITVQDMEGKTHELASGVIPSALAQKVRDQRVRAIDLYLE